MTTADNKLIIDDATGEKATTDSTSVSENPSLAVLVEAASSVSHLQTSATNAFLEFFRAIHGRAPMQPQATVTTQLVERLLRTWVDRVDQHIAGVSPFENILPCAITLCKVYWQLARSSLVLSKGQRTTGGVSIDSHIRTAQVIFECLTSELIVRANCEFFSSRVLQELSSFLLEIFQDCASFPDGDVYKHARFRRLAMSKIADLIYAMPGEFPEHGQFVADLWKVCHDVALWSDYETQSHKWTPIPLVELKHPEYTLAFDPLLSATQGVLALAMRFVEQGG